MTALRQETLDEIADRVSVPGYGRSGLATPIVHVGVGGFHRSHQAMYTDALLRRGENGTWAICGAGVLDSDAEIAADLRSQDLLYSLVEKPADGADEVSVIGSLADFILVSEGRADFVRRLAAESTRIVSLTVTEGGYTPENETFALIAEALASRRAAGLAPFTVMSCDNLEGNGARARDSLLAGVGEDSELGDWIGRECSFPSSMVDRITPATTEADRDELAREFGVEDRRPVVCEPFAQWVLEDDFTLGRPDWERVGVQVVEDVRPYELMKLRLLNAGHQALAHAGLLIGLERADDAASDPAIAAFVEAYWEREASPTLPALDGIDLADYRRTLLERFRNPAIGDTVERLAAHASDRIPAFVLPVARDRLEADQDASLCAAICACWARAAAGKADGGEPIETTDARAGELAERGRAAEEEPERFLELDVFDGLRDDERFSRPFADALATLRDDGAERALDRIATAT